MQCSADPVGGERRYRRVPLAAACWPAAAVAAGRGTGRYTYTGSAAAGSSGQYAAAHSRRRRQRRLGVHGEGEREWSAMGSDLLTLHSACTSCDKSTDIVVDHCTGMCAEPVPESNGATVHVFDPKITSNRRIQSIASRDIELVRRSLHTKAMHPIGDKFCQSRWSARSGVYWDRQSIP